MGQPRRGEVWLVDLGMVAKVRSALVISVPATDSDRALVTLVPHTTSVRASRFEAAVRVPFLKEGAFDCQNLITIPHAKLLRVLGRLPAAQLTDVEAVVQTWLGLGKSDAVQPTAARAMTGAADGWPEYQGVKIRSTQPRGA